MNKGQRIRNLEEELARANKHVDELYDAFIRVIPESERDLVVHSSFYSIPGMYSARVETARNTAHNIKKHRERQKFEAMTDSEKFDYLLNRD
jgi:hypothetical protein